MDAVRRRARRSRRRAGARRRSVQQVRPSGRRRTRHGCARCIPGALCVSALTGEGRDEVIAAMETRLGLDTARISVTFPAEWRGVAGARRRAVSDRPDPAARGLGRRGVDRGGDPPAAPAAVPRRAEQRGMMTARWSLGAARAGGDGRRCGGEERSLAPPVVTTPKFPDFIFPAAPNGVGTPAAIERHQVGLELAAGRRPAGRRAQLQRRAETVAAVLSRRSRARLRGPGAEEAQGLAPALRPRGADEPALRARARRPRRSAARARRGAGSGAEHRGRAAGRPVAHRPADADSRCSGSAASSRRSQRARSLAEAESLRRGARGLPRRDRGVAAESVPSSRAGGSRAAGRPAGRGARITRARPRSSSRTSRAPT